MVESDVDQAALVAAELLGTTTTDDTVNAALREIAQRNRRLEAFGQLAEMARDGQFNELFDKKNYRPVRVRR